MPVSSQIIADFAIIMTIAAVFTFIFHKLKQPLILGYLIAGVIIGPYTPPFSLVSRPDVFQAAAELGVILLLFAIGLEFPLSKLRRVLGVSLGVGAIEIAFMFVISFGLGRLLGWPLMDSLFLGAALASSSTAIIAKVLTDMGKLKDVSALVMFGVLVAEDIFVIGMLAGITTLLETSSSGLGGLAWSVGKTLLFVVGTLVIGGIIMPRIIDSTVRLRNNEVLILTALGLAFGMSVVANLLGFSMAIGAFLIGVTIASARYAAKVAALTLPVKDMFGAMFFVSVGALIDVTQFRTFLVPSLLVTAMMMTGKIIGCGFGAKLFRHSTATSIKVGLGMCQIGEFAFIVMAVGLQLNVISPFVYPTVGVAAAITTFLTPYLVRLSYRIAPDEPVPGL